MAARPTASVATARRARQTRTSTDGGDSACGDGRRRAPKRRIFKDPMTTAAAVDRLVDHAVTLERVGSSVRADEAEKARKESPSTTTTTTTRRQR
jgi:hypothetical protein